eukprot:5260351-Pleurochrysis_carterae.AAC.1
MLTKAEIQSAAAACKMSVSNNENSKRLLAKKPKAIKAFDKASMYPEELLSDVMGGWRASVTKPRKVDPKKDVKILFAASGTPSGVKIMSSWGLMSNLMLSSDSAAADGARDRLYQHPGS